MSETLLIVLFGIGIGGMLLCLLRAARGPTTADRVVGVDGMVTITTALLVLLGFLLHRRIYLDVSLVYAVLAFVGVLVIARYLERGL